MLFTAAELQKMTFDEPESVSVSSTASTAHTAAHTSTKHLIAKYYLAPPSVSDPKNNNSHC
jgi:hypothetical protein